MLQEEQIHSSVMEAIVALLSNKFYGKNLMQMLEIRFHTLVFPLQLIGVVVEQRQQLLQIDSMLWFRYVVFIFSFIFSLIKMKDIIQEEVTCDVCNISGVLKSFRWYRDEERLIYKEYGFVYLCLDCNKKRGFINEEFIRTTSLEKAKVMSELRSRTTVNY